MKPFLLITTREESDVAAEEYEAYQKLTGLGPAELEWRRAEREPLGLIDFDRFSGIILGGSPYTVSEPIQKKSPDELRVERELGELLDEVVAKDFPFLGICYGIGTIGLHQGATVDRQYGEDTQTVRVTLTSEGHRDPLFQQLPTTFDAYVGHKEAISDVPSHITVLASSPSCPVQAFRVNDNVYATQFHPELDAHTLSARVLAYADHGYFDPNDVTNILDSIASSDVRASHLVLGRFVEEYARAEQLPATASPVEAAETAEPSGAVEPELV